MIEHNHKPDDGVLPPGPECMHVCGIAKRHDRTYAAYKAKKAATAPSMTMAKFAPRVPAALVFTTVAEGAVLVVAEAALAEVVAATAVLEMWVELAWAEAEVEVARVEEAALEVEEAAEELVVEEAALVEVELALEEELGAEVEVEAGALELEDEETSLSCAPPLLSTLMLCQLPDWSP